jgi:hypothetical protein
MKSRKETRVSLLIESSSLSLEDISSMLGHSHSTGSHQKGSHGPKGRSIERTIWRLDSSEPESATVEQHLVNIASQLSPDVVLCKLPKDVLTCIDIAMFFDTAMCSANISVKSLAIAQAYKAAIEISCYPSDFEAR